MYGNLTQAYIKLGDYKNALLVCLPSIGILGEAPAKYYIALSDILFSLEYHTESLRNIYYVGYNYNMDQSQRILKIIPLVTPLNFCFVCKVYGKSLKKCGKCKIVKYCSPQCQKIDWETHKKKCFENKF